MCARSSASIPSSRRDRWKNPANIGRTLASIWLNLLRAGVQHRGDRIAQATPLLGLASQLLPSTRRQAVVFCFSLVFRFTPLTGDPALVLQTIKGWVERTL